MPLFSIIIPSHNGAERIRKALDSCRAQEFTDYELIVVCDSCTDNTAQIAHEYTDHVLNVSCRRDGLARNAGLDIATGDWILFLDDDDWWLHEFALSELSTLTKDQQSDWIEFGIIWRTVGRRGGFYGRFLQMIAGHCIRRSFIGSTRFDDASYSSDTHFIGELTRRKPSTLYLAFPLYYYNYMRPGSLSDQHMKGVI